MRSIQRSTRRRIGREAIQRACSLPAERVRRPLRASSPRLHDDFKSFFSPRHIYPVKWEELPTPDTQRCVVESFGNNLEIQKHPSLLADWEERIVRSRCPVYPVPDEGLLFHARWSQNATTATQKSHRLATDAFLATQRLKDGHRLIWWYQAQSDADDAATVLGRSFHERYLQPESPFYPHIEARRIDAEALARGTCASALVHQSMGQSVSDDLERTLILSRHGGIWIDNASVLVRDLTPLIRTGPLVPAEDKHAVSFLVFHRREAGIELTNALMRGTELQDGDSAACDLRSGVVWPRSADPGSRLPPPFRRNRPNDAARGTHRLRGRPEMRHSDLPCPVGDRSETSGRLHGRRRIRIGESRLAAIARHL